VKIQLTEKGEISFIISNVEHPVASVIGSFVLHKVIAPYMVFSHRS